MFPDFTPVFQLVFFAIGFVPAIVVGAIVSVFFPIPLWGAALAAIAVGFAVAGYMSRNA